VGAGKRELHGDLRVRRRALYVESVDALVDRELDDVSLTAVEPPEIEDLPPLRDVLAEDFVVGAAVEGA
jgi:endo-1,4-beta-xylanase